MITDADGQISRAIHLHDNASKGRSGRTIPMHNELRLALRDLYREVKPKPDDFVISTERSKRASPQVIVNLFARWYEILGFNGSHSGRRTFITNAARKISTVRSTRARDSGRDAREAFPLDPPGGPRARARAGGTSKSAGSSIFGNGIPTGSSLPRVRIERLMLGTPRPLPTSFKATRAPDFLHSSPAIAVAAPRYATS